MLEKFYVLKADLKIFDGGAAGTASASAGDSGSAAPGVSDVNTGDNIPWHLLKGGKPQELVQEDEGAPSTKVSSASDNEINAESWKKAKDTFGDFYKKDVETQVKRRMKNAQTEIDGMKPELEALRKIRDSVAVKYPDIDVSDSEALLNAINGDDSYLRQRALDNGRTIEQERADIAQKAELEALRAADRQRQQADALRQRAEVISRQVAEVKEIYPDFDLEKAYENEDFQYQMAFHQQVKGTPNVRAAYEAAFGPKLREQAVHQAADATKQAISQNLIANQYMPSTAGKSSSGKAPVSQFDISKMSARELADRAYAGEDISKYFR